MTRDRRSFIEHLESRTFLSASVGTTAVGDLAGALPPAQLAAPNAATGIGLVIRARAGVPFTKEVAFFPSPVLNAPDAYVATINWGDDVTSQAALTYGSRGTTPGYLITGSHVYADPGIYGITTTVSLTSNPIGTASNAPTTSVVATIISEAIVAARPAISPNGVTLTESTGQQFSASVGAVFLPAVQDTVFTATINWGDGSSSTGHLAPTQITNAAGETEYQIIGTHTYVQAGTYPVRVVVDELPANASAVQIAVIHSGIVVQTPISLAGTITGTYRLSYYNPIITIGYRFTGTGTAGDMGAVTLSGTINIPGTASTTDKATGRITLTNSSGSVTLQLTGPTESPLGPIPSTMSYKIISSTGAFFDDVASGTISITTSPPDGSTPVAFTFVVS